MRDPLSTLALLLFLPAASAAAATLKVPQQYDTIIDAVLAANDGDTILLAKGRHTASLATNKRLSFKGAPGAIWDAYVSGSRQRALALTGDGVTISGIRFEHGGETVIEITGDDATVTKCRFKACDGGIYIDGGRARVLKNRFAAQRTTSLTIEIDGPDADVSGNQLLFGTGGTIDVEAEGGGARVSRNLIDTHADESFIYVEGAVAPVVERNVISNVYHDAAVIEIRNSNDAVVDRNRLETINYYADGIYVQGARAGITRNTIDSINCYSDDCNAIEVTGDDAEVLQNKIRSCSSGEDYDTYGVYVEGDRALVARNRIDDLGGGGDDTYGVYVDGSDARIERNSIMRMNDEYTYSIDVDGARASVLNNRIAYGMYDAEITVDGDDFRIVGNSVRFGAYYCRGIEADGNATSVGSAVIENNKIANLGSDGIDLSGNGVTLRNNTIRRVAGHGFELNGDDNVLVGNTVVEARDDGFTIRGARNTLMSCKATDCGSDGFELLGTANRLERCSATDCAEEGIDNSDGGDTEAVNCKLKGSRIDYAGCNAMADDTGTKYDTGGPDVFADFDN